MRLLTNKVTNKNSRQIDILCFTDTMNKMNVEEFYKKVKKAVSLRPRNEPAPTHNDLGEEDWEPELERLHEKARQLQLKKIAEKRIDELYYDVHARTRTEQRNKYKMWYIKKFLFSPLLPIIPEI